MLYRNVRSKEQLYDLMRNGVLAEVDRQADPWTGQVTMPWPAQERAALTGRRGARKRPGTRDRKLDAIHPRTDRMSGP